MSNYWKFNYIYNKNRTSNCPNKHTLQGSSIIFFKASFITLIFKKNMGSAAFSQCRDGRAKYMALPDNYTPLKSCAGCVRADYILGRSRSRAWLISSLSSLPLFFFHLFILYFAFKDQQPRNEAVEPEQPSQKKGAGVCVCWNRHSPGLLWMCRATDSKDSAPAGKGTPFKLCWYWYFGQ